MLKNLIEKIKNINLDTKIGDVPLKTILKDLIQKMIDYIKKNKKNDEE